MSQFYTFDGTRYEVTPFDEQSLLEAISEAVVADVQTSNEYASQDERDEAVLSTWQNTDRSAEFWDNVQVIMRDAPTEIVVERLDVNLTNACRVYVDESTHVGWRLPAEKKAALVAKVAGELEVGIREGLPTADLDGRVAEMLMENDTSWEALGEILDTVIDPYL